MKFLKNNIFYIAWKDIQNFFRFRRDIKEEKNNVSSTFNKLNLKTNWLGNIVYTQKVLSRTQMMNHDLNQRYIYLLDQTRPENEYFDKDLMWGEYLTFNTYNFYDPNEGETDTYAIIWKFSPFALGTSRFFWSCVLLCGIICGTLMGLVKYGII
jgi:hypothetical protein